MKNTTIIILLFFTSILLSGCRLINNDSAFVDTFYDTSYRKETFIYKEAYGNEIELDIVFPNDSPYEELPVIVYIHGGGYKSGNKDAGLSNTYFWYVNSQFLEAGYMLVTIDYTLANEEIGTTMEDCFVDAKDAIRWLYMNEEELGIDTSNIGVFGSSAGGGVSTMLGYTSDSEFIGDESLSLYSSNVSFVINFYGGDTRHPLTQITEFESIQELPEDIYEGLLKDGYRIGIDSTNSLEEIKARMEFLSCMSYMDDTSTPTISFHGTEDNTVDYSSSVMIHEVLDELDVVNELVTIEGMGHGFLSNVLTDEERFIYADKALSFAINQYVE